MSLTHKQAELLRFIVAYQAENRGASPSYKEMGAAVGVNSKSGVYRLTIALQERGFIHMIPNRARCITVLKEPDAPRSSKTDLVNNHCPHCCGIISIPFKGHVS